MAQHNQSIEAFVKLGEFLRTFCDFTNSDQNIVENNDPWVNRFTDIVARAYHHNGWFTQENIAHAFREWSKVLTKEKLGAWVSQYDTQQNQHKKVAIIMAGNIPLVGFHDFLSVLITGNTALVKLSSNDKLLIPLISEYLTHLDPSLGDKIEFSDNLGGDFDAVIATGSNNTARYFEYYFGKKPHIIRKNRNSVAILKGTESKKELQLLGEDIFRYYGLGCRSVSKLLVPHGYDFDNFYKAIYDYKDIINETKYANNYDYNKAVYLMSEFKFLDNGFLVLKEDESYASPIASVFYEYYDSESSLKKKLNKDTDKIQCVVGNNVTENAVPFGNTQKPELWDYADGVDTVEFLLRTS
ncbi:acyl-CoA reductase [Maribacter sp. MMG018]|uniref:acyl-CoA reductase n=1 Tax=Maribacter sp. MMG018 TaxID=2822688 RepID=UPI001B382045|nr:acyl-CoA reductase [Maribacter sp. MMG018]MBQ4915216.1 acyl-CoA reductase [Maribacter sp. MMG018]